LVVKLFKHGEGGREGGGGKTYPNHVRADGRTRALPQPQQLDRVFHTFLLLNHRNRDWQTELGGEEEVLADLGGREGGRGG